MVMKRSLTGAIAALTLVAGLAAAPDSHARDRLSPGAAAAIGVLGGLAVGGAIAASAAPAYAAPAPVYMEPAPVYVAPAASAPGLCRALLHGTLQRIRPGLGLATGAPARLRVTRAPS